MNWQTYLTDEFPSQFAAYAAEHPDTSTCVDRPHCCQAPQERRVLFERGQGLSLKADFACAWYGLTLLEQGLFRYFPEQLEPWLQEHPGLKLPVTWTGMGCVRVMTPQSLITGQRTRRRFSEFLEFYTRAIETLLQPTGITAQRFFEAIAKDADFKNARRGSCYAELLLALRLQKILPYDPENPLAPVTLAYLNPHDDSLNLVEAVPDRKLHYIAFAQPGLTQVFALAEFSPGVGNARARSLFSQVNKAGETGTLLPRRHLTFLPTPAASYGGMDTTTYRENGYSPTEIRTHLQDAIQAHLQYARCDALYFDFREGPVDAQLYHDCLQECLAETEFPEGTHVTNWK